MHVDFFLLEFFRPFKLWGMIAWSATITAYPREACL